MSATPRVAALLISAAVGAGFAQQGFVPQKGFVPAERTAIVIARDSNLWCEANSVGGAAEGRAKKRPMADYRTLQCAPHCVGGVAEVRISVTDGHVLYVMHGK